MLVHIVGGNTVALPKVKSSKGLRASRGIDRDGTAAVEFALVLPFVMVVFLGIIEFGRVMMVQQVITNAAREACRSAVLPGGSISSSRDLVTTYLSGVNITLSSPTTQITVSPDPTTATQGTAITVSISVPYNSVSWLPNPIFMGGKTLSATVVMRLESNST